MAVFGDYAKYYDLLYREKNYSSETSFVLDTLSRLGRPPATLLDLGSGTGRHAFAMARRGVSVTGVDMSEVMLSIACLAKACDLPAKASAPEFKLGDARHVRLGRAFDAVTALFHVMSYQTVEEDALAVLTTAHEHLKPGGVFLFDFWYGPGVLNDRPVERRKELEDADIRVQRDARPVLHVNDNVVDVNYSIAIRHKVGGKESTLSETHRMRYWFLPELKHLARSAGFSVAAHGAWLSCAEPDDKTWLAWMAVQRRA